MSAARVPALVLRSAGTNCDGETLRALERAGAACDLVHLNALAREPARLARARIAVLPGGFSYGDYVAAGRIFALELRARLGQALSAYVQRGGALIGICNGFQVLMDLGLFEGRIVPSAERRMALTDNASNRFECRWVTLRGHASAVPWIRSGELLRVPVAHAEGRLVVREPALLDELFRRRQVVYTYGDPSSPAARSATPYPHNPNGSSADIAGLCDPSGRVLGLMPHPERNLDPWHDPQWTRRTRRGPHAEGEGLSFWRRMVEAARAGSALEASRSVS
jgi:phosphoribosylformylglycinamidine synthase